jgi:hypothetical protein
MSDGFWILDFGFWILDWDANRLHEKTPPGGGVGLNPK